MCWVATNSIVNYMESMNTQLKFHLSILIVGAER